MKAIMTMRNLPFAKIN